MKWDNRVPCASCPYRRDVPTETWHVSEFENLLAADADSLNGATFGCHKWRHRPQEERRLCVGWFLDQQRRGYPSIRLRLLARREDSDETQAFYEETNDGGLDLYASLKEMCEANGALEARTKSEDDEPDGWKEGMRR